MTIVNEQYTISHLTVEQHKKYYYIPPEQRNQDSMNTTSPVSSNPQMPSRNQASTSPMAAQVTPVAAGQVSQFLVGLNEQQVAMIQQFSVQSRLNIEWSK